MAVRGKNSAADIEAKRERFELIANNLEVITADRFLKDNFLPYAWSFTLNRALTSSDGLKPVQRRILYTMFKRGLSPTAARAKVATLGGAVLAFHPHGDSSVSEAIKNMARSHIFRVPMIDGKGDFGEPGTPGGAPRYLEARLNKAAWINVEEISENAVQMVQNYDETDVEPSRIPIKWPVSIINGGSGIAVGYATNIPSHNPNEIMKAAQLLLDKPEATDKEIMRIVKGPDFNMGGVITSNDGVKKYLETGSGSFKIRGKYTVEQKARGRARIEFHEIPFGTYPEKIITEIQRAAEKRDVFKGVSTYKDLSDLKNPIRVVIETKSGVQYQKVLQELFAYTSLENSFSSNITTIINDKPVQSSMRNLLIDFIEFRKSCVINKMNFSHEKKTKRLHLIEGLLKALLDIDEAISIIRNSNDAIIASTKLQKKFKIDEDQASYILGLQLRRLTKMDSLELKNEKKNLDNEIKEIHKILTVEEVLNKFLHDEFNDTLKVIGSPRKTEIFDGTLVDFIASEKESAKELKDAKKNLTCFFTRFANGTVMKSAKKFTYSSGSVYKDSPIIESLRMKTQEEVVIIDSSGMGHRLPLSFFAMNRVVTPSQVGAEMGGDLVGIAKVVTTANNVGLALATENGAIKITKPEFPKRESFPVIGLVEGDKVVNGQWLDKTVINTFFTMISKSGNIISFDAATIRVSGAPAGGVAGMKLRDDNDKVIAFNWVTDFKNSVIISQADKTIKNTPFFEIPSKGRGGLGVILQSMGKGESSLHKAFVGVDPILTIEGDQHSVGVPPMTRRALRGSDFTIPVLMGVK